ncbi:unnamed protein product [Macrosiphum euphorbiae]|uniref:Uncharacterized protein n=1 Tax=Macrosiphum euphorbiae TaxID=13131 RepID=A0AAV0XQF2_9HEMI|nr:unnamed protein product [Macrosiphum euphorbiae]
MCYLQLTTISGPREISFLQEYCNVMKPISRALDILQGDKNVSLGYLHPTINAVHKSFNDMNYEEYSFL